MIYEENRKRDLIVAAHHYDEVISYSRSMAKHAYAGDEILKLAVLRAQVPAEIRIKKYI